MAEIFKVSGPLVIGEKLDNPKLNEIVKIGPKALVGEILRVFQDKAMIQVYESTQGLKPGHKIEQTGEMYHVELGPGMLTNAFDGIQRPLEGDTMYLEPGVKSFSLDRNKKWKFSPKVKKGDPVKGGDVLGVVQETPTVDHKILVPPFTEGVIAHIEDEGEYTIEKIIAKVKTEDDTQDLKMYHKWPARKPRPIIEKQRPKEPLLTGLRVLDFFFPAAKGGTIAIPGGFGTGKTQLIFQMIKWSDADVLVYVGCGERGNEIITVLDDIAKLIIKGELLDERTVYVVNTSNMPVAARTSGIFSGMTIAEYFRDQGKNVVILADSLTRWAEAMREISNRMGEFPGEEGYPTYLASEIGNFFERAGKVRTLSDKKGSITTIGTVSLYGSDFADPVAQAAMKVVNCFWALDPQLAYIRQYPAINREVSYSKMVPFTKDYWNKLGPWEEYYEKFLNIFGKIEELERLTSIMGKDMLSGKEQFMLGYNELMTELFLKQSALVIKDAHRTPKETMKLAELLLTYYDRAIKALEKDISIEAVQNNEITSKMLELKHTRGKKYFDKIEQLMDELVFVHG